MKVNILMPTYNDEKTIASALDSLVNQSYDNWHLTIINDGSVDDTEKVVKSYIKKNKIENKVTYIYQTNKDQLNAIKNGLSHIEDKDSIIFTLHSDDVIDSNDVLKKAVDYFNNNSSVDAIIADYDIINEKNEIVGTQKIKKYNNKFSSIPLMGLWLGRNIYVDVAFFKYEVYKKIVYYNYLTWNTPFWFCSKDNLTMLNVKNVDFKFFKYRVFEGNYINNEVGLLSVLNGELRTELLILNKINIPFYKLQYFIFRAFNKLHLPYKVIYQNKRTKKLYDTIKFVINKRISDADLVKYPYYNAILNFFKNYQEKTIEIKEIAEDDIYFGSDARGFNKRMVNNDLPKIYYDMFSYMDAGFNKIITDKKSYDNVVSLTKFLDIYPYIDIEVK